MIDILNKKVRNRDGKIYVIERQDNNDIDLSNGKTYNYIRMFESKAFSLLDETLQDMVSKDVEMLIRQEEIKKRKEEEKRSKREEWAKVKRILDGQLIGRDISCERGTDLSISKCFYYKKEYGTKALTIYESGIDNLGFNPSKKCDFDLQKLLYSQDCTKEKYSVWLLPYSNVNGQSNGKWVNLIEEDKDRITQYIFVDDGYVHSPNEKRLTFVKQKNGEYVFLGVYYLKYIFKDYFDEIEKDYGKCFAKEIYYLHSKNYPEDVL